VTSPTPLIDSICCLIFLSASVTSRRRTRRGNGDANHRRGVSVELLHDRLFSRDRKIVDDQIDLVATSCAAMSGSFPAGR
jgi:hypothetical protein